MKRKVSGGYITRSTSSTFRETSHGEPMNWRDLSEIVERYVFVANSQFADKLATVVTAFAVTPGDGRFLVLDLEDDEGRWSLHVPRDWIRLPTRAEVDAHLARKRVPPTRNGRRTR